MSKNVKVILGIHSISLMVNGEKCEFGPIKKFPLDGILEFETKKRCPNGKIHFYCEMCKEVFTKDETFDQDAEQVENFGRVLDESDKASLCDDCYIKMTNHPDWEKALAETRGDNE